ncbi:MAG: hypothetical protein ACRDP4_08780 [Nocardioidaceae bacterium]
MLAVPAGRDELSASRGRVVPGPILHHHQHHLNAYQLRRWFAWRDANQLDPLVGIQRAHGELYIRHLRKWGLMASSVNTMMHGARGFLRFTHIDGSV